MEHEKRNISCDSLITRSEQILKEKKKPLHFDRNICTLFQSKKHYVVKTRFLTSKTEFSSYFPSEVFPSNFIVIKLFNEKIKDFKIRWENEIENYGIMKEFNITSPKQAFSVPKRILYTPGMIIYEEIQGKTLEDLLVTKELNQEILLQFANGLYILHQNGYSYGDQRFRNFIYSENRIFCVDYEDITNINIISKIDDLANILAVFLESRSIIFEETPKNIEKNTFLSDWLQKLKIFYELYGNARKKLNSIQVDSQMNKKNIIIDDPNTKNKIMDTENWMEPKVIEFWIEKIILALTKTAERRGHKKEFDISRQDLIRKLIKNTFSHNLSIN